MVKIKYKAFGELSFVPTKATEESAGFDLKIPEHVLIPEGRSVVKLGFGIELPKGYAASIRPRSGFSLKGMEGYTDGDMEGELRRFNCDVRLGLIDSDYRGECGVILMNNDRPFFMKRGTRIAQMVIEVVPAAEFSVVDDLGDTERGEGGFGHTGSN